MKDMEKFEGLLNLNSDLIEEILIFNINLTKNKRIKWSRTKMLKIP